MSFSGQIYAGPPGRAKVAALRRTTGNNVCAECGDENPEWACLDYGVFLCIVCSGIFRSFSRVRSISLDDWKEKDIEIMSSSGNVKSNQNLEVFIPECWVRPFPGCGSVIRQEWIFAKYKRKEFAAEPKNCQNAYIRGTKEGWLYKLKKQGNNEWQHRWFVLDGKSLKMYLRLHDPTPKHSISIDSINVTMETDISKSNAMQIITTMEGRTRNIYVYSDSGCEIMEWYCAIRAARYRLLKDKHPDYTTEQLKRRISHDFIKSGYMQKTPRGTINFQKRWFTLEDDRLSYYKTSTDAAPLGVIALGSVSDGFLVEENASSYGEYAFILHTPSRKFPLIPYPENREEKLNWISEIQKVVTQPPASPRSPSRRCNSFELDLL